LFRSRSSLTGLVIMWYHCSFLRPLDAEFEFLWAYANAMPSSFYTSSLTLDFVKECDVKRESRRRRRVKLRELLCSSANMINLSAWWAEPLLYDNCWKLRHTQYGSHIGIIVGSDSQLVLCLCLSSILRGTPFSWGIRLALSYGQ
jgi:hypothetical protein